MDCSCHMVTITVMPARYTRETVAQLAQDGMRLAAIAQLIDADYERA